MYKIILSRRIIEDYFSTFEISHPIHFHTRIP